MSKFQTFWDTKKFGIRHFLLRTFGIRRSTVQWNVEIQTKRSSDFRRSDFGHLGCSVRSIVWFELLCIGPNKNCLGWTIRSDFRHKFSSEIQTKLFGFWTLFEIQTFYNRMIIDGPKAELVQISSFHCSLDGLS